MEEYSPNLTLHFDVPTTPPSPSTFSFFPLVYSQLLKRKEHFYLRRKPPQYEKLELAIQQRVKNGSCHKGKEREEMLMLQKCKNFLHIHKKRMYKRAQYSQKKVRVRKEKKQSMYMQKVKNVMVGCQKQNERSELKQHMSTFTFYCKSMDKRLENMHNVFERKERMI